MNMIIGSKINDIIYLTKVQCNHFNSGKMYNIRLFPILYNIYYTTSISTMMTMKFCPGYDVCTLEVHRANAIMLLLSTHV